MWDHVERVLDEMTRAQEQKLLALARRLVPHVTPEDLRNPHDFAPLLESAEFNFEDGILAGPACCRPPRPCASRAATRPARSHAADTRASAATFARPGPARMDTQGGRCHTPASGRSGRPRAP
jgi:hypothetical protein